MRSKLLVLLGVPVLLAGCGGGGGSNPVQSDPGRDQPVGSVTAHVVGANQAPVVSSKAGGANAIGLSGATIDGLVLNFRGKPSLKETRFAYSTGVPGDIYVVNFDGSGVKKLTNNPADESEVAWSPDGSKLVFSRYGADSHYHLWTMNADGTNQVQITSDARTDTQPSWSPNGKLIAFTGNYNEIYLCEPNGANVRPLTSTPQNQNQPSWSPDSLTIVCTKNPNASNGTIRAWPVENNANFSNEYSMLPWMNSPAYTPDGTAIIFESAQDMYRLNLADGSTTKILTGFSGAYDNRVSPDGSAIAYLSHMGTTYTGIALVNSDGSNPHMVLTVPNPGVGSFAWSGYLPRTAKGLVGAGAPLGTACAGFLYSEVGPAATSVLTFDTPPASRSSARIAAVTASETNGSNLVFSVTTSAGLSSVKYAPIDDAGRPGAVAAPYIPSGSTDALVTLDSNDGRVVGVLPFKTTRAAAKFDRKGDWLNVTAEFTAIYDAKGQNVSPSGTSRVRIDTRTGRVEVGS